MESARASTFPAGMGVDPTQLGRLPWPRLTVLGNAVMHTDVSLARLCCASFSMQTKFVYGDSTVPLGVGGTVTWVPFPGDAKGPLCTGRPENWGMAWAPGKGGGGGGFQK